MKCQICGEYISEPICIDCMKEEVIQWLGKNNSMIKIVEEITKDLHIYDKQKENRVSCIVCGKKMSICRVCYMNELYEGIKMKDKKLADRFKDLFYIIFREIPVLFF